jgi:hypothetical protein
MRVLECLRPAIGFGGGKPYGATTWENNVAATPAKYAPPSKHTAIQRWHQNQESAGRCLTATLGLSKRGQNMDIGQFLDKNAGAIIAVAGTIFGVLVTALFNLWQKKAEWINQKRLRQLERSIDFEECYLIRPTVEYMEAELQILQRIYSKGVEKDSTITPDMYQGQFWKMLLTSARVKVYGNKELTDTFEAFTRKRIEMGNSIFDQDHKNLNLAYRELKEAESIAVQIFTTLKNKLSDI